VKKIIQLIKDKNDWIMVILGSYMASYNLLAFDTALSKSSILQELGLEKSIAAFNYYYPFKNQIGFAVGVTLIIWGILIYKQKKQRP